jgi:hypothetical protein
MYQWNRCLYNPLTMARSGLPLRLLDPVETGLGFDFFAVPPFGPSLDLDIGGVVGETAATGVVADATGMIESVSA